MKKSTIANRLIKTWLLVSPLLVTGAVQAALPALRVDDSKRPDESGYLYRVIDGRNQAVTLPGIEIDLLQWNDCDSVANKKCVSFTMVNRDAWSPLSSEVERFQVRVQRDSVAGDYHFLCDSVGDVKMYGEPNFVRCEFKSNSVNSTEDFKAKFGDIRRALPVSFEITFKALGRKVVTIPVVKAALSINVKRVEDFVRAGSGSLSYESQGRVVVPRSVGMGLVQIAVGYNPCWVGLSDDSWKTAPAYLKGITDSKSYNTLLFGSNDEAQRVCKSFKENAIRKRQYSALLLSLYDRLFDEALEDWGEASFAIKTDEETIKVEVVLAQESQEWQEGNKSVGSNSNDLNAYEFAEIP